MTPLKILFELLEVFVSEREMGDYNLNEADYLLREAVNSIKGSVDQIYFGLFDYLDEDEKVRFLDHLKERSDSLQDVLFKSIIERAKEVSDLNSQLVQTNRELNNLKDTLELKVNQRTKEIKEIQHTTIFALARLAESRDNETGNHLNRMRTYSYLLAKQLSKDKAFDNYIDRRYINNIYESSPLHDIGKVGIQDEILLKPARLSPEEFEVMKSHTVIGGKTLEDAEKQLKNTTKSFLAMGKNIAYCHHEKWDGSGYPYGLKGTSIPLSARIVAVADVYDALTSKRIYKDAFDHKTACEIIIDGKEKHFDPTIVDAFIKLKDKFLKVGDKNRDEENIGGA